MFAKQVRLSMAMTACLSMPAIMMFGSGVVRAADLPSGEELLAKCAKAARGEALALAK